MWSRIYYINIEIYSYGNDIQIIDGDEFILDKECIRLLYCNKGKWGEQPNHYDLMHPIENSGKKVKKYIMKDRIGMDHQQRVCDGDYEIIKDKQENHKIHHKRTFEEEKEGGTLITSIILYGSQTDFEDMLDHCKRSHHAHSRAVEIERRN
eukprot:8897799-Heterocapsa_arctica.AAC.1